MSSVFLFKFCSRIQGENEPRLQSDRERLHESQLACVTRQLRSRTTKAINDRKKLEEKCLEASEQLEIYQDQSRAGKERSDEILRDAEDAKQQLVQQQQQLKQEHAKIDQCRSAC